MNQGPFYYWTKKSMKPTAMLETLAGYYNNLAASYLQKGMSREAEVFSDAADNFRQLESEIEDLLAQRADKAPDHNNYRQRGIA